MTGAPEFSRLVEIGQADGRQLRLEASEAERKTLAARFGLVRIDRLEAELALDRKGQEIAVSGRLAAEWVQSCAVSAEDFPVAIDEALGFRFIPASAGHQPDEEVEIGAEDCDEIEYSGTSIDLGEAVAQSLALAIDPYATGPDADEARAGLARPEDSGPFAALREFKPKG
jgi:uncharacterized metal-binding protein YceD (DUF177 family)